ncbi:MAG: pirin family protein [Thermaurantimonas sp.]|uniref:pirin family protein n=1 Tax=Thermaurantimonas sp. TaxID=2681568 RepID=UPI00391BD499
MIINILKSEDRGKADLGWLKTRYSFSFSNYYNPRRMHFGMLRVLNDDHIAGGMGFGMHPHDNMEIITIPTAGGLRHRDSMGNSATVHAGEVQVMSAGKGIYHSEVNPYQEPVELFQIWIFPDKDNVEPRYDQKSYSDMLVPGQWSLIVGPKGASDVALWIHQNAFLSLFQGNETPIATHYTPYSPGQGLYLMVVEGNATVEGHQLNRRDSIEVYDFERLNIETAPNTQLLAIEVPIK